MICVIVGFTYQTNLSKEDHILHDLFGDVDFILLIYLILKNYRAIYFGLCWVFAALHGLSLVAMSRGYSLLKFLTVGSSLVVEHRL